MGNDRNGTEICWQKRKNEKMCRSRSACVAPKNAATLSWPADGALSFRFSVLLDARVLIRAALRGDHISRALERALCVT